VDQAEKMLRQVRKTKRLQINESKRNFCSFSFDMIINSRWSGGG
jgi:hypothetical protein